MPDYTPYVIDSDRVDMSMLPFKPQYDGTTIFKGQRIHALTGQTTVDGGMGGGMMMGTINASEIDLVQQGLRRCGWPIRTDRFASHLHAKPGG